MTKWKKIFIGLFLILTLFSCSKENSDELIKKENSDIVTNAKKEPYEIFEFLKPEYKESKTFNDCIKTSLETCAINEVKEKANKNKDEKVCEDLGSELLIKQCKEIYIIDNIQKTLNLSECDKVNNKFSCYSLWLKTKAIKQKNYNICIEESNKLNIEGIKDNCLLWYAKYLTQDKNDTLTKNQNLKTVCWLIDSEYWRNLCKSNFLNDIN